MLEFKEYTAAEIGDILHTSDTQGIKRKLERYGVEYTTAGRGKTLTFNITKISDPFKVFCITQLGFNPQVDFFRLKYFLYYFFNDEYFQKQPLIGMEELMDDIDKHTSRKTISNWIKKLEEAGLIMRDKSDFTYYSVHKGIRSEISHETYSAAWKAYWDTKSQGYCWAISAMLLISHGYPTKVPKVHVNGIYTELLDKMNSLIIESIEKDRANNKTG